jgi:hypothetical protein
MTAGAGSPGKSEIRRSKSEIPQGGTKPETLKAELKKCGTDCDAGNH